MREPLSYLCGPIILSVRQFNILFWFKFYDKYFSDGILSQRHLMLLSVLCDMCKDFFKETFFEMNKYKFPKKESINF